MLPVSRPSSVLVFIVANPSIPPVVLQGFLVQLLRGKWLTSKQDAGMHTSSPVVYLYMNLIYGTVRKGGFATAGWLPPAPPRIPATVGDVTSKQRP